jgi:hypothetical protein
MNTSTATAMEWDDRYLVGHQAITARERGAHLDGAHE